MPRRPRRARHGLRSRTVLGTVNRGTGPGARGSSRVQSNRDCHPPGAVTDPGPGPSFKLTRHGGAAPAGRHAGRRARQGPGPARRPASRHWQPPDYDGNGTVTVYCGRGSPITAELSGESSSLTICKRCQCWAQRLGMQTKKLEVLMATPTHTTEECDHCPPESRGCMKSRILEFRTFLDGLAGSVLYSEP